MENYQSPEIIPVKNKLVLPTQDKMHRREFLGGLGKIAGALSLTALLTQEETQAAPSLGNWEYYLCTHRSQGTIRNKNKSVFSGNEYIVGVIETNKLVGGQGKITFFRYNPNTEDYDNLYETKRNMGSGPTWSSAWMNARDLSRGSYWVTFNFDNGFVKRFGKKQFRVA